MHQPDKMMKKVLVGVEVGAAMGSYTLTDSPVVMEFIYGAGVGGMTPLEISLDGLEVEGMREVQLEAAKLENFLGCQYSSLRQAFAGRPLPATIFLRLTLRGLAEAEPREVVQALAQSLAGGGCGGNCGCGCG